MSIATEPEEGNVDETGFEEDWHQTNNARSYMEDMLFHLEIQQARCDME